MKNFNFYKAEKYNNQEEYEPIKDNIYKFAGDYVTSLTFEMDNTRFGEEDACPQNIPQFPLEDMLDKYMVYISDFYGDLNRTSNITCYLEFGSDNIENIRNLLTIIGKQFYAVENNGKYNIIIED